MSDKVLQPLQFNLGKDSQLGSHGSCEFCDAPLPTPSLDKIKEQTASGTVKCPECGNIT